MTAREKTFKYFIFVLFAACLAFALSAALEFSASGAELAYLQQGMYLIILVGLVLAAQVLHPIRVKIRVSHPQAWAWSLGSVIFLCGFLVRLYIIQNVSIMPSSDYETYFRLAVNLAKGTLKGEDGLLLRAYVEKFPHTIGFPFLLAPVFRIFGTSIKTALYVNLAFSMGSIVMVYLLGQLIGGRSTGLIAMLLAALWPSHILYGTMVATEPSFSFLLLAAFWAVFKAMSPNNRPKKSIALLLLTGVLLGIAGSVRPVAVLALVSIIMALFSVGPRSRQGNHTPARIVSTRTLCALLIILAYIPTGAIISQRVYNEIGVKPVSGFQASGYNLMVGVNVENQGQWNQKDSDYFEKTYQDTGSAQAAHEASMEAAVDNITSHPLEVINLMIWKFRYLWRSDDFGIDWNLAWLNQQGELTPETADTLEAVRPIGRVLYMLLLMFSLIGIYRARRHMLAYKHFALLVVVLLFLATAALHMLLETQVRYHYHMIFFLILPAAFAISGKTSVSSGSNQMPLKPQPEQIAEPPLPAPLDIEKAIKEGLFTISVSQAVAANSEKPDG